MIPPTPWDLPTRLRSKVVVSAATDCWLWTGARQAEGYGRVKIDGKVPMAYRVVYELLVGEIPQGLTLDHLCLIPACVNPLHLQPTTTAENARRAIESLRAEPAFRCGHERNTRNTLTLARVDRPSHRPLQTCLECDRASQARHGAKRNAERRAQRAAARKAAA